MSARRLAGRALITGGTSGIGLGYARHLALRGLDIVLVARNAERLESTAAELRALGVDVEIVVADLATPDGVATVVERLASEDSPIEVYVNNAGHGLYTPLTAEDMSSHRARHRRLGRPRHALAGQRRHHHDRLDLGDDRDRSLLGHQGVGEQLLRVPRHGARGHRRDRHLRDAGLGPHRVPRTGRDVHR
jgi:NAD(P)-dependent dehydrogenase (short-subunit alcohol dehydrogenase family)